MRVPKVRKKKKPKLIDRNDMYNDGATAVCCWKWIRFLFLYWRNFNYIFFFFFVQNVSQIFFLKSSNNLSVQLECNVMHFYFYWDGFHSKLTYSPKMLVHNSNLSLRVFLGLRLMLHKLLTPIFINTQIHVMHKAKCVCCIRVMRTWLWLYVDASRNTYFFPGSSVLSIVPEW